MIENKTIEDYVDMNAKKRIKYRVSSLKIYNNANRSGEYECKFCSHVSGTRQGALTHFRFRHWEDHPELLTKEVSYEL